MFCTHSNQQIYLCGNHLISHASDSTNPHLIETLLEDLSEKDSVLFFYKYKENMQTLHKVKQ